MTRTASLVVVANPDAALKLYMFARARMPTSRSGRPQLVPTVSAIQMVDGQADRSSRRTRRTAKRQNVEVKRSRSEFAELRLSGLAGGARRIVAGSFYLKTGSERIGGGRGESAKPCIGSSSLRPRQVDHLILAVVHGAGSTPAPAAD